MIYKFDSTFYLRIVANYIEERGDDFSGKRKRQRQAKVATFWDTAWGRMLNDPQVADPSSFAGKKIRRRFRIPFALFHEWLVPICREKNLFGAAQSPIPLEFKVLVALRILGRNNTADDTNELSGGSIGDSTCNEIFKTFVVNFAKECYHESVREPEGEDLLKVMEMYRLLGFPGAIGSMDCTHVHWGRCPPNLKWQCIGKEGYSTIAFQCVVDHTRRILHVSNAFIGGTYNKAITAYVPVQFSSFKLLLVNIRINGSNKRIVGRLCCS